eukprot:TRINITY_DN5299_c0_g1_i14.p1 TRINITY_DN5299_c0_g1~~TRINITY_DN5299_c0_g1_i14.p1  ORF type:complete len:103 (-),score=13.48 TRINITY_DN5299_c0_g1_i14:567-875(-)
MNDAMSLGIHRFWKDHLIDTLAPIPGTKLLDVAGGTGDVAFRFINYILTSPLYIPHLQSLRKSSVTVIDINPSMLQVCLHSFPTERSGWERKSKKTWFWSDF